ncbi:hypothetical protein HER14_05345 [Acidithiobacillus thiooxidans]|uniref:Uncharacterized protein n=1 Tax=Acidithiobacillus thiooxidans TaxID=930 RepID=A0A1C2IV64_ACITH|nr:MULTISPECIES: hypothetical protein [Acidithiobacillus]MBE7566390.1 hypothetical protein [Acidithiobacillus sp. HP-11]MBU2750378.1 hypothetical protein [Acidithiobacillus thiooxidans]MBU2794851.1 hypothetical protein [Acidithiobacillus thiooxidans]OCX68579.1 hypothetical protein A6M23_17680 [Acidithiobacillus thiooxidans]OCX79804.1 hypothetical protein A6P08_17455 [Acidithiobacillus thiooxidans]
MIKRFQHRPLRTRGKSEKDYHPTLLDVLNILEKRLDIVEEQCAEVLHSINISTRTEVDDQIAIMDAEINRCQKLLKIIKNTMLEPESEN